MSKGKMVTVSLSARTFARLEKVAKIMGKSPEALLNEEVAELALCEPTGMLPAETTFKKIPEMEDAERRQYEALDAMGRDGWRPTR